MLDYELIVLQSEQNIIKMTKKESLAYDIADYMCHPADSIEIGGISQQLLGIIQNVTRKDKKLRDLVVEYLAFIRGDDDRIARLASDALSVLEERDKGVSLHGV